MDHESFTEVVLELKDVVYGYALHLLGKPEDAEDVVQDTFLAFWRQGESVDSDGVRAWVLRVCRNGCIDRIRRRDRRRTDPIDFTTDAEPVSDAGRGALAVESALAIGEIARLVAALPEPARSIVVLRDVFDLDYAEIARATDTSLAVVKVTLHRARRRLRRRIEMESRVAR